MSFYDFKVTSLKFNHWLTVIFNDIFMHHNWWYFFYIETVNSFVHIHANLPMRNLFHLTSNFFNVSRIDFYVDFVSLSELSSALITVTTKILKDCVIKKFLYMRSNRTHPSVLIGGLVLTFSSFWSSELRFETHYFVLHL